MKELNEFPPASYIKHNTSLKFPLPPNSVDYMPETPDTKQPTNLTLFELGFSPT